MLSTTVRAGSNADFNTIHFRGNNTLLDHTLRLPATTTSRDGRVPAVEIG